MQQDEGGGDVNLQKFLRHSYSIDSAVISSCSLRYLTTLSFTLSETRVGITSHSLAFPSSNNHRCLLQNPLSSDSSQVSTAAPHSCSMPSAVLPPSRIWSPCCPMNPTLPSACANSTYTTHSWFCLVTGGLLLHFSPGAQKVLAGWTRVVKMSRHFSSLCRWWCEPRDTWEQALTYQERLSCSLLRAQTLASTDIPR